MTYRRYLLAALASVGIAFAAAAPANPVADRVRGHVEFLASDLLEGREAGTKGHELAAAYVAAEFRKLGLAPGGDDGSWYQKVPLRRAVHSKAPTLEYSDGGQAIALTDGKDFGIRPSLAVRQSSIDAPLVFVGHGISAPRYGLEDYSGIDVRGKIVVAIGGAPPGLPSDVAAHLRSMRENFAAERGAVGLIVIAPKAPDPDRPASLDQRSRPRTGWADASGATSDSGPAVDIGLSEEMSQRIFDGSAKSLEAVRAEASKGPVRGFALPGRMRASVASEWTGFDSPNVVGRLEGSDPTLAAEHIVLMAHLDHVGINPRAKPGEDAINNGALDNATGIATMIEAARLFVEQGAKPRRSILFIANTAEEKGLLGADYFAARPTVPIDRIVGLINLDMPLLLYDFTDVIAFGAEHSTIGSSVAPAARSMGVALSADPMPEQTLFVRSDHYPLVKKGVPSIFLMTGHANGGKQGWDDFLSKNYHRPGDDLSQPINWTAAARFADLNYRIARALADSPIRPRWYSDSFFGESFAAHQLKASRTEAASAERRP